MNVCCGAVVHHIDGSRFSSIIAADICDKNIILSFYFILELKLNINELLFPGDYKQLESLIGFGKVL